MAGNCACDPPFKIAPDQKVLILDLDGTLVQTFKIKPALTEKWGRNVGLYRMTSPSNRYIFVRPGLDHLLRKLSTRFLLAVWSTGKKDYVESVTDVIDPFHEYFSRDRVF